MYLKNGLLAIIISDPLTTTSGASLSVRVGAMSDPDKLQGLAHFCEHMLFLGSKKYPNGDDYFKTVSENNGHFNAYTDREMTNYFFDIHYLSFESALDIFSRFFIDPLFKEEKLNKEINSVNSEYEKNLIIDSRKRSQIFAYLTDADDPYHRFTTGNIETLLNSAKENGMNLRDELLKFHKKYYTSDKMKLVIYTNEDIEDMEEIVVEKFSLIQPSEEYINMNSNADLSTKSFEHKQTQNVNNSVIDSINNFNDKHNNTANLFLGKVSVNENKNKNSVCLNNYNMNESRKANKSLLPAIFVDKKSLFCEKNINSKERYDFQSPFSKNILGTLISYQALTQEYDLNIAFIQKSLRSHQYYNINPSVYFSFLMDSKEENSLINSLKKRNLASKLQVSSEREYDKWSDLVLDITLTEKGIQNLDKVFMLISNYLSYMRDNLISQEYFNYLKKVEDLKFQEKNLLSHNIYDIVSKSSARAHHYPITYILKENIFEGEFDMPSLNEYARNLILENSLIFIPDKHFNSTADKYDFLQATNTSYEPWYKTNYNLYKIDFTILNKKFESSPLAPITKKSEDKKEEKADTQSMVEKGLNTTLAGLDINKAVNQTSSIKIPTTFSGPKLYEEEAITNILSNMSYKCDLDCIEKLESFNTKEPDLLNKTATFELWHKQEFTLDFNKMLLDVQFVYDSYKNHMEKVLISLLQTYVKRKLKRFSTLLKIFSSSLSISKDSRGLKLSFECINEPNLRKKFFEELARKMFGIFNTENISEFNFIMQETKDKVNKEYNSQPYVVAYDYLKDNTLEDHIRFDQQLKILEEIKFEDFKNFIKKFEKKVYFKFLFFGSIDEKNTRSLFGNFNELIALPKPETPKKIFSIAEKRKNKQSVLKLDNGNYLIRKLYHQEKNKNNCFLKCYFVDKKNFKSEIMVKLFNSIIGNIVFRELRINRQFGYVAKSRYEVFNDQLVKQNKFFSLKNDLFFYKLFLI